MSDVADLCQKCDHPRIFHFRREGCLFEYSKRYYLDPRGETCSCTAFKPEAVR